MDVQLGLLPEKDLTQVLSGQANFHEAITRYNMGNFDVMAGSTMSGSFNNINTSNIGDIWKELKKIAPEYDLVLIDTGNCMDGTAAGVFDVASKGIMVTI